MMKAQMKGISLMIILLMLVLTVQAAALRGTVTDEATKRATYWCCCTVKWYKIQELLLCGW